MSDVLQLIVERLEDDAAVGAAAGDRIYPAGAEMGAARPYITYQLISSGTINDLAPNAGATVQGRLQVNCWASTYAEAVTLADAVRASLNGWRDTDASPRVDSSLLEEGSESDIVAGPHAGTDVRIFGRRMDFQLWYATD